MNLVTIEQVRAHCRAETDDDALLTVYADASELQIQEFLNRQVFHDQAALDAAVEAETAGDDPMVVNPMIVAAVLLATAEKYRDREPKQALPESLYALLWPFRVGLGA